MNNQPLVTIGIPTWNRGRYLSEAIASVLGQTYTNLEIVVSDNASTDDTQERLAKITDPRVRYFRNSNNVGMVPNLNLCLQHAAGELFLMLSDDDLLEPTAIECLSQPFREGVPGAAPDTIGVTWCPYLFIDPDRNPKHTTDPGPSLESAVDLLAGLFDGTRGPNFSSVMVRTQDARSAGGYDGARHGSLCDSGNWGRVSLRYPNAVCIPEPLMRYTTMQISSVSTASIESWQTWCRSVHADLLAVLREEGNEAGVERLTPLLNPTLANTTAMILMRKIGTPGWIGAIARECWRSRRIMLTPFVFKRVLRDGFKLLRNR